MVQSHEAVVGAGLTLALVIPLRDGDSISARLCSCPSALPAPLMHPADAVWLAGSGSAPMCILAMKACCLDFGCTSKPAPAYKQCHDMTAVPGCPSSASAAFHIWPGSGL